MPSLFLFKEVKSLYEIDKKFHKLVHYFNPDISLELARPNKLIVGNITEAFDIQMNMKIGQIKELSFSIPYSVERNFQLVKNKNVDKIKQRYLLQATFLNNTEWFIITDETDDLNDTNVKHVTAYSLGYQLTDKYIREWAGVLVDGEYRKESLNAKQVMDNILSETSWNYDVNLSDSLFLTRSRAFEISNTTRLEAVIRIAETFNAVIEWDTHNKTIVFKDTEKYSTFNGLFVSDSKYLNSYEKVTKSSEMATRLKLYGKDGLTINEINPSGMDYIEDLSFFLKGFSMDQHGNTLSHSEHASEGLCKAIINYQNLITALDGQFTSLLTQKEALQTQLKEKQNQLFDFKNELVKIQAEIDIAETRQQDATAFKNQETSKKSEITSKESEINLVKSDISNIDTNLTNLRNQMATENNFSPSQLDELDSYIIEKTWENENISDVKELMELGRKELDKINTPNVMYNIGLVHLLRIAEAQKDIKKLRLGDKIRIHKKEIDEIVEATIIEMQIDFSKRSIALTIANFSTNKNDDDALAKLIYSSSVATSTVNMNKSKWDDISNVGNFVNEVLNNSWDSAKREIESGALQSVKIDNRGITTFDMVNPNKFVRIMGGIVGLTTSGGKDFKTAITGSHIVADVIQGRLIVGQGLYMENEKGIFKFDQFGVTIKNTALTLTADSGGNGITMNASDGLIATKSDGKVRSIFNATDGIKVQVKKGSTWNDEFYYDVLNESLTVDGAIHARELKINGESVLTDKNTKINGLYVVNLNADNIKAGTITGINITGSTITGGNLNIGNGNFTVDSNGYLTSKKADISGVFTTFNSNNKKIFSVEHDAYNSSKLNLYNQIGNSVIEMRTWDSEGGIMALSTKSNYYNRASTALMYAGFNSEVSGVLALREKERAYANMIEMYTSNNFGGVLAIADIGDVNDRLVSPRIFVNFRKGLCFINDNLAIGKVYGSYKLDVSGDIRATSAIYMNGASKVATENYVDEAIAKAFTNYSINGN